jgi:hypothetical protein
MENKKKLTPEEEAEIEFEILSRATANAEIKFIICIIVVFLCGVFPWLIGMGVIVRFLGKTLIF